MPDGDESIALSWTPRTTELADAQRVRNCELGGSTLPSTVAVLLAVLGAAMLMSRATLVAAGALFGAAIALSWVGTSDTVLRRRWTSLLAGNPALGETVDASFDGSGVRTVGERRTISRRWSAFTSWSDTPGAVVLATSDTVHAEILVVPHRAATRPGELEAIRSLAERHLGPPLGSGPGRGGRRWWPWVARSLVLALLVVPLGVAMSKVHDESGQWLPWPTQSPPLVSYDGLEFHRTGGATSRPDAVTGVAYTPGGGLILEPWPRPTELTEIWVLDHNNVVRHYVAAGTAGGG